MDLKWVVGALAVIVVVFGIANYVLLTKAPPVPFGTIGQNFTNFTQFAGGKSDINRVNASSTLASVTMSGSEFINNDQLDYTINNAANDTLTLPASTTAICSYLSLGERRVFLIRNASTTSENLTIAGSASILLKSASSTAVIPGSSDGTNFGILSIERIKTTAGGVGCVATLQNSN